MTAAIEAAEMISPVWRTGRKALLAWEQEHHHERREAFKIMERKMVRLLYIVSAALILSACSTQQGSFSETEKTAEVKQPVQAFGVVKALGIQDVAVDFPIEIKELLVQEGQVVTGGETLAIIDPSEAETEVEELECQIEALKAELSLKQKKYARNKEIFLKKTHPDIQKLENALKKEKKEYDRLNSDIPEKRSLFEAGALSEKEYLDYLEGVEAAEYACIDTELTLKSLMNSLQEELEQAEAEIHSNLRLKSGLERRLQKTKERMSSEHIKGKNIVSVIPVGIVSGINCKPGETVPAGAKLFSIMDEASMVIEANVDEQFIKDVKPGAKAYVIPECDTALEYRGKVTSISAFAVQQNNETVIPVQISLGKRYEGLRPGYNMEITIEVGLD